MRKKRRSILFNFSVNGYDIIDFYIGDSFVEATVYYCRLRICDRLIINCRKTWEELENE